MRRERICSQIVLLKRSMFFYLPALLLLVIAFQQQGIESVQHASAAPPPVSYHVDGKHILDSHGYIFIPYGVLIDGILLAQPNWRTDGELTYDTLDQMQAAQDFWHANTVRLQIGSKALFAETPYDPSYLAKMDQDVQWATQLGMNIIITLQYEGHGNSFQVLPTRDSANFWDLLSKHYKNDPRVFFDIFNEPDPTRVIGGGDTDSVWNLWQNGGTIHGKDYVGMQQLVDTIRGNGAQNLIFAEGLAAGEDIELLPQHLLQGGNIVYAIHPYLNATNHHTPAAWDHWFGNTAANGDFPVVADEWGEYQSTKSECITDAPAVVPQFLAYLKSHNIGLIAYGFWPGTLIRGWDFRNPTTYTQSSTTCTIDTSIHSNLAPNSEGAGQLIRQYLIANSNPGVPPSQTPFAQSFFLPLLIGGILLILIASLVLILSIRRKQSK